jgi:predicted transcriptional regulator
MKIDPALLALKLAQQASGLNISQTDIASATGVNQSQVSRIFDGKVKRHSKALVKISKFIEMQSHGVSIDIVKSNNELMEALASTWDGTSQHSTALATIIKTLKILKR